MKIIIPCCDLISYKEEIPRFLTKYNGITLLEKVIKSIKPIQEIIIPIYNKHYEMAEINPLDNKNIKFCVFNDCFSSQPETINATIKKLKINESIFIKDSDSVFDFEVIENSSGYICVESLNNFIRINVNNKSYVVIDHNASILNIREKMVISDLFNVGGYYFTSANEFTTFYEKLNTEMPSWNNQIHLSDIIGMMILEDKRFEVKQVSNYKDYGTKEDYEINIMHDD